MLLAVSDSHSNGQNVTTCQKKELEEFVKARRPRIVAVRALLPGFVPAGWSSARA